MTKTILLGTTVAAVMVLGIVALGLNQVASQEMEEEMMEEKSGIHLIDTETISLTGKLQPGDFKLLMDITGYISESGHVAMKVPCGPDGEQLLAIVSGVAPDVVPMDMDYVAPLSDPPNSCVYHGEIPEGITDIALINTSEERVKFFGFDMSSAGYSVTITIHGEAGEGHNDHM